MDVLHKFEKRLLQWLKNVPHLPIGVRKWLGENIWWIVLAGVVIGSIWAVLLFFQIMANIAFLGTTGATYHLNPVFVSPWVIVTGFVSLFFSVITILLSAFAIQPLKARMKQGWVLLFIVWLVNVVAIVVGAILSLNPLIFIFNLLFGAIFAALVGYLLFEIHGQFAHDRAVVKKPIVKQDEQ